MIDNMLSPVSEKIIESVMASTFLNLSVLVYIAGQNLHILYCRAKLVYTILQG